MKTIMTATFACSVLLSASAAFRPPAVPLAVNDPYLSLWSPADRLTDAETMHWSRDPMPLSVVGTVNGKTWRFCGAEPKAVPAARQVSLDVGCTITTYRFDADGREVEIRFLTPFVPGEWEWFSRPVSYLSVKGLDAETVAISPAFATDDDAAAMVTNRTTAAGLPAFSVGRREPKFLQEGDRVRPNGGTAWLVGEKGEYAIAYDSVKDFTFLGREIPAWWRRGGKSFEKMLEEAIRDREAVFKRAAAFDAEMGKKLARTGGTEYAALAKLAWRQCFGAAKLAADPDGEMVLFTKENTSNGCIATVDILYPTLPALLCAGPEMVKAALRPDFKYAASGKWPYSYAPHDLGMFPRADGQRYNMGRNANGEPHPDAMRMPVEECGNMILATAALALQEGNADFAARWWPLLGAWADYLAAHGIDPADQLCTDDFLGRLARNANLSAKSVLALGAYARLCALKGDAAAAKRYRALAEAGVKTWLTLARGGKNGATVLAFGQPGTWSLKYNLAMDRLLNLKLFPIEVFRGETALYVTSLDPFGLPLDSRSSSAMGEWTVWAASFADQRRDFERIVHGLYAFADTTPDRVPFANLYDTKSAAVHRAGKGVFVGMNSRSTIGGLFLPVAPKPKGEQQKVVRSAEKPPAKIGTETDGEKAARMKWFTDARFGMFIHFGLYSLPAWHEWHKTRRAVWDDKYDDYFRNFNPDLFDAREWVRSAKAAGMRYMVLTAKHHEGFCLWDTKYTSYKITNTPFGRDLVKELADACHAEGMRFGFYYSLLDWHHPDFTIDQIHPERPWDVPQWGGLGHNPKSYDELNRTRDMAKYRQYMKDQITELLTNYGKIDLLWYDWSYPDRGKGWQAWDSVGLVELTRRLQPGIIINDRLDLGRTEGGFDFVTVEQRSADKWPERNGKRVPWETCQTFSGSWGYSRDETNWKSREALIALLAETVSKGGNLILNVGPTGRGDFDYRAKERLAQMGEWLHWNARAVYGCTRVPDELGLVAPKGTVLTWNPETKKVYMTLFEYPDRILPCAFADRIAYAQFLHDASEVDLGLDALLVTDVKPNLLPVVIEITLK